MPLVQVTTLAALAHAYLNSMTSRASGVRGLPVERQLSVEVFAQLQINVIRVFLTLPFLLSFSDLSETAARGHFLAWGHAIQWTCHPPLNRVPGSVRRGEVNPLEIFSDLV